MQRSLDGLLTAFCVPHSVLYRPCRRRPERHPPRLRVRTTAHCTARGSRQDERQRPSGGRISGLVDYHGGLESQHGWEERRHGTQQLRTIAALLLRRSSAHASSSPSSGRPSPDRCCWGMLHSAPLDVDVAATESACRLRCRCCRSPFTRAPLARSSRGDAACAPSDCCIGSVCPAGLLPLLVAPTEPIAASSKP